MPGSLFKEIPLDKLAQVLNPLKATFLVLQRRPEAGEVETLSHLLQHPLHDVSHVNEDDLDNMLALLYLLDDYIGVSNTNMHLMAGIGKTARVLTPFPPDYRWLAEGDESPWFKGFKVYRQTVGGDWSNALEQLTNDLTNSHKI
jgi:ADP-heptose:LPS heptosyltransferase